MAAEAVAALPGRRERRAVLLCAAGLMLLTCVPYLIAAWPGFAGPDLHFQGFLWGTDDGNVYRMYIRQSAEGAFFLRDQYTVEPQNPRFFNVLFTAMGGLTRLTGLPSIVVYHLFRVALGVVLLYLFWLLAVEIGLSRRARGMALLLAGVGSGLGWLVYLAVTAGFVPQRVGNSLAPVDLAAGWQAVPEAVTFLTLLLNPLFIAGMALMCAALLWGLRAAGEGGLRAALICGLLLLLLGNVHGYDVFMVYAVLFCWFLAQALTRRLTWSAALGRYALIALLGAPTALWQFYVSLADPVWAAKGAVPKLSAGPSAWVVGYGLVGLLALVGAWHVLWPQRQPGAWRPPRGAWLAVTWMVLGLAAVYSPLLFQRKLSEGLHLPLCLLAGMVLGEAWGRALSARQFRLLLLVVVGLTAPSNLIFVTDCLAHMQENNRSLLRVLQPPPYLSTDEVAALRWLGENSSREDVLFCSNLTGSHVPAYAPCTVALGHWDETLHFTRYLGLARIVYSPGALVAEKWATLQAVGATLLWYGPQERLLQQGLTPEGLTEDPGLLLGMAPVLRQGQIALYRLPAAASP